VAAANAAFWVDDARPITHLRLRYEGMFDVTRPDRSEYLMQALGGLQGNVNNVARRAQIDEFHIYNEIAAGGFGFFIDIPFRYLQFEPGVVGVPPANASGFADMYLGTKSLLLDCDLIQFSFQFTTYLPTGQGARELGVQHVSLEPALVGALKLAPGFYTQFETALWIPIGGTAGVAGDVWHNRCSLNKVLWCILPDVQLIGTAELVNWNFISGSFTSSDFFVRDKNNNNVVVRVSDHAALLDGGFGLRLNVCDRIDFGVGILFPLTGTNHFIDETLRAEFRWRF
jgi:hypothetical protein